MTVLSAEERQTVREAIDRATRSQIKPRSTGARPPRSQSKTLVKALVVEREPRIYGRCGYCGHPCRNGACPNHWDLYAAERKAMRAA